MSHTATGKKRARSGVKEGSLRGDVLLPMLRTEFEARGVGPKKKAPTHS